MTETSMQPSSRADAHPATGAAAAAVVAGACSLALAIYQVATPGPGGATYESFADWLREGLFTAYLAGSIVAAGAAERRRLAPRVPALLVMGGYALILLGVAIGMVLRDDPDWFMLLGGPGQLLSMAGFIAWAVVGWRRRTLPGPVALLAGIGGAVAVLGSELGLSVLVAAFWLWLAARLRG
jgi:hypothetical protein